MSVTDLESASFGEEDLIGIEILLIVLSDRSGHTHSLVTQLETESVNTRPYQQQHTNISYVCM